MTTRRLAILLAVLAGGLGIVGLIPRVQRSQPAGIELELPAYIGEWEGKATSISESERVQLGPETEFSRKLYKNPSGNQIYVSVVLAGRDMNTSIHRPERCLPSQGWTIAGASTLPIPLGGSPARVLKVTRLSNQRNVELQDGRKVAFRSLDYYWFVGYKETTASHAARMLIDIRDRLLQGYNQRWAYITVAAPIMEGMEKNGLSEKETDALMADFIRQLIPKVQKPEVNLG